MNSARLLREMGEVDSAFVDTAPIEHHIKKRKAGCCIVHWRNGCIPCSFVRKDNGEKDYFY